MLVLAVVVAFAASAAAEPDSFAASLVQSERGFEGAVQVIDSRMDGDYAIVTADVPYRDVRGEQKTGRARLVVARRIAQRGEALPPFCHVHYEKDVEGAKHWAGRGWAVTTGVYGDAEDGAYPLELCTGNSYNLSRAIICWVRRLPFIDRGRLHIDGGSAGGYMALAMAAECFPVTSVTADMPVVNWPYNLNYFHAQRALSGYPSNNFTKSPLPFMCAVTMLADWSFGVFGDDLTSETWFHLSPISYVDRITAPVSMVCATGDMLVPIEQMSARLAPEIDPDLFPDGYTRDFESLTLCAKARVRFVDAVPGDELEFFDVPLQQGAAVVSLEEATGKTEGPAAPQVMDRPWSQKAQWSVAVLNEGPPAPFASHTTYKWSQSPETFVSHYQAARPSRSLLNAAKLNRLLRRYSGSLVDDATLPDGVPINRLQFNEVEQYDVATALLEYAEEGWRYRLRLKKLYRQASETPFGDTLSMNTLEAERARLAHALGLAPEQE